MCISMKLINSSKGGRTDHCVYQLTVIVGCNPFIIMIKLYIVKKINKKEAVFNLTTQFQISQKNF